MAHCWVPFMVVLWWRDQLIDSGPLLAANNKVYWFIATVLKISMNRLHSKRGLVKSSQKLNSGVPYP